MQLETSLKPKGPFHFTHPSGQQLLHVLTSTVLLWILPSSSALLHQLEPMEKFAKQDWTSCVLTGSAHFPDGSMITSSLTFPGISSTSTTPGGTYGLRTDRTFSIKPCTTREVKPGMEATSSKMAPSKNSIKIAGFPASTSPSVLLAKQKTDPSHTHLMTLITSPISWASYGINPKASSLAAQ